MRVLITNDDGVHSAGVVALARAARSLGEVVVAAPRRNVSGAGTSLLGLGDGGTIAVEERIDPTLEGVTLRGLEAHPALIVLLARYGAFGDPPDMVLSGINTGPNTGQAVLHSGTVGAALTAASLGMAAAAFSTLASEVPPAETLHEVVQQATDLALAHRGCVVNINFPATSPWHELRRAELASTGAVEVKAALSGSTLRVSVSPLDGTAEGESDTALLAAGFATLTVIEPLAVHHAAAS
jgi:5'-nucleotidase